LFSGPRSIKKGDSFAVIGVGEILALDYYINVPLRLLLSFIASGECPRPFGVIGLGEFVAERERMYLLKPYCVYVAPGTCGKNQFPTGVQFSLSPG